MDENDIRCIGCSARSPEVETEYTLISSRFGWRLTRRIGRDGSVTLEWRCPPCWARFKQDRALAMTPSEGVPASSDPPSSRRGDSVPSSRRDPKR